MLLVSKRFNCAIPTKVPPSVTAWKIAETLSQMSGVQSVAIGDWICPGSAPILAATPTGRDARAPGRGFIRGATAVGDWLSARLLDRTVLQVNPYRAYWSWHCTLTSDRNELWGCL